MASKTCFLIVLFLFFSLPLFISAATKSPPTATCDSTPYPRLCRSLLASVAGTPAPPEDTYFYERQILIKRALRISTLIHRHFQNGSYFDANRSDAVALEDCRQLFEINADLIGSVAEDLGSVKVVNGEGYDRDLVHRVRTRLSAVLANRRTCHDDLVEAESPVLRDSNGSAVVNALTRSERVYSVALGLVTQALSQQSPAPAPPQPPARSPGGGHHGPNQGHHGPNQGHHRRTASPSPPSSPPPAPPQPRSSGGRRQSPSPASGGSQDSTQSPPRSSDGGDHQRDSPARSGSRVSPPPPPRSSGGRRQSPSPASGGSQDSTQPPPRSSDGGDHQRDSPARSGSRVSPPPPPPRSSGGGRQRDSPASGGHQRSPPPPPPPVPSTPERRQSLSDLIKGLKRSPNCTSITSSTCSKGRLILPGLQGKGIIVGDAVTVSKDGTGDFTTIGAALKSAPDNIRPQDGYFVIYSKKGVYEEYISVSTHKKNILLLGDGINKTIITGNHSNAGGWGTSNSATFAVAGDRFIAIDVSFRNTYGPGSQAVAVRNQGDHSAFFRCSFEGYQDTLYAHSMNQFYRDCHVYGTIDFIFGDAAAVFQNSYVLGRRPRGGGTVVVTAQGRESAGEATALSFHNCTVDAAPDLAAEQARRRRRRGGSAFLGRPWKPYARVVYMQSTIGDVIDPRGWMEWNGSTDELDTVYYGEYGNNGPGSGTGGRVTWPGVRSEMSDSEALSFTVGELINGGSWLPDTCIPFTLGLLPKLD